MPRFEDILDGYSEDRPLTRDEAVAILNIPDYGMESLIKKAYGLRTKYKGNKVSVQLLTNVRSGGCTQDCAYCAQSCRSSADIEKYRSVSDERLYGDDRLVKDKGLSRHCIGLSGIEFSDDEIYELAERIRIMKKSGTHICCSIGFLTEKQAKILKEAGLDRINHNLNTSRRFYPQICSTHTYERRMENIRMLKAAGFEICCGGIVGMGEDKEDIADMLLDIREISPQSVPVNFLLPIEGTRLSEKNVPSLTTGYCTRVLCLARLMLPRADIRCAAGREVYFSGQEETLFKIVDSVFAAGYLTAAGQGIDDTLKLISSLGYEGTVEGTGESDV